MSSLGRAVIQYDWCPYKRRWRQRCKGRRLPRDDGGRLEWCIYKPKNVKGCQQTTQLEEAREDFPVQILEQSTTLSTPWFQTSSLQNWINTFLSFQATQLVGLRYSSPRMPIYQRSNFCAVAMNSVVITIPSLYISKNLARWNFIRVSAGEVSSIQQRPVNYIIISGFHQEPEKSSWILELSYMREKEKQR